MRLRFCVIKATNENNYKICLYYFQGRSKNAASLIRQMF